MIKRFKDPRFAYKVQNKFFNSDNDNKVTVYSF